jgi:hypothetical protein
LELIVTALRMKCEVITADDVHNPLAPFDSVDYYVSMGEGTTHKQLKLGNLGDWHTGDEKELNKILWDGEAHVGTYYRIKFMDDDLLLDDYLGEIDIHLNADHQLVCQPGEDTEILPAADNVWELHLRGSGAHYTLEIRILAVE